MKMLYHWNCFIGIANSALANKLMSGGQAVAGETLFRKTMADAPGQCNACGQRVLIGDAVVKPMPRETKKTAE